MSDTSLAEEYNIKFDFFFVALVFGILALSIQTSNVSNTIPVSIVSELFGWFFLTWCGLVCLGKMSWVPLRLYHGEQFEEFLVKSDNLLKGVTCENEEEYEELQKQVDGVHDKLKEHDEGATKVSGIIGEGLAIQQKLFFAGIVCLVISRFSVKVVQLYHLF